MARIWYHGDSTKRSSGFHDQKMNRDADRDPNAQGPGIYWTADKEQAKGYAYKNGYVYTAEIRSSKIIKDSTKPNSAVIRKLILLAPKEDLDVGLSNWGYDESGKESFNQALEAAVNAYTHQSESLIDSMLMVHHDIYRKEANTWTQAMVKCGIDAYLHKLPAVEHLIVYNPNVIKVLKEEPWAEAKTEALDESKISDLFHVPVVFVSNLSSEAREEGKRIAIGPKFFKQDKATQFFVLVHEAGHWFRNRHVSLSDIMGWAPGEGFYDLFGAGNSEEGFAEAFAVYATNPSELKHRYPEAYEKMEHWVGSSHEVLSWAKKAIANLPKEESLEEAVNVIDLDYVTGIRKSWKKLLAQAAKATTFDAAMEEIQNIQRYVERLAEDLLFNKGLWTTDFEAGKKYKGLDTRKFQIFIKDAKKKLANLLSNLNYNKAMLDPSKHATLGSMAAHERDYWQKNVVDARYGGSWGAWEKVAAKQFVTDDLAEVDDLISQKLLRDMTKFFELKTGGEHHAVTVERELNVGKVKVIFQDQSIYAQERGEVKLPAEMDPGEREEIRSPWSLKEYVRFFRAARAMLDHKKLGRVWYGEVFVRVRMRGTEVEHGAKKFGKAFADYSPTGDTVRLYGDPGEFVVDALVHELGHRYYYKFMTSAERHRFVDQFGDIPAVSEYGATGAVEDFAMVFEYYVMNRHLTRDQLERLKSYFSGRGIRESLIRRVLRGEAPSKVLCSLHEQPDEENMYHVQKLFDVGEFQVWAVDGEAIRNELDSNFTNFAQHYCSEYVPEHEFWIDQDDVDEADFYVTHMAVEYKLMKDGMGYDDALDIADEVESAERAKSGKPREWGGDLEDVDEVKLEKFETRDGVNIWLVDGELVRNFFDVEFTEGGHDLIYPFIPQGEIWLDDDVNEDEREYVIVHELTERQHMNKGLTYNQAHRLALQAEMDERGKKWAGSDRSVTP